MSIYLTLAYPFERDGVRYEQLIVKRPGPFAFARFSRRMADATDAETFGMFGVPADVVGFLHPADQRRLTDAMTSLTMRYVWPVAIWRQVARLFTHNQNRDT